MLLLRFVCPSSSWLECLPKAQLSACYVSWAPAQLYEGNCFLLLPSVYTPLVLKVSCCCWGGVDTPLAVQLLLLLLLLLVLGI